MVGEKAERERVRVSPKGGMEASRSSPFGSERELREGEGSEPVDLTRWKIRLSGDCDSCTSEDAQLQNTVTQKKNHFSCASYVTLFKR